MDGEDRVSEELDQKVDLWTLTKYFEDFDNSCIFLEFVKCNIPWSSQCFGTCNMLQKQHVI